MKSVIAVKALKRSPLFRYTSVRLLADLVHKGGERRARIEGELRASAAAVVVLDGTLRVTKDIPRRRRARKARPIAGAERPEEIVLATLVAGETYVRDVTALEDTELRLVATSREGAEVLLLDAAFLLDAARASFSL